MKKISMLFFALWFTQAVGLARETWLRGTVSDQNNNALPYACIGIAGTPAGTISRSDGTFQLFLPTTIKNTDTLRISYLGFQTYNVVLQKILTGPKQDLVVTLLPKPLSLAEVHIRPRAAETKILGSRRENTVLNTNYAIGGQPLQNLGAAIGKRFNLKGKPHFLKQVNLYLMYNTFDTVVFRVNLYRLKGGKPRELLNRENIYWTLVKHRKGWAGFDLSPYNLVLDEKVLLSLEWVGHSKRGHVMGVPLAMPLPGAVHYYKFGSQDNWKIYQAMSTSINLVTETEK